MNAPAATSVRTRRVVVSARKVGNVGAAYTDTFLGLPVVFTTFDGEQRVGVLESFDGSGYMPVIRFSDGTWARGDYTLAVVAA